MIVVAGVLLVGVVKVGASKDLVERRKLET
jgi:hypothetical protein